MAFSTLLIEHSESSAQLSSVLKLESGDIKDKTLCLGQYLKGVAGGIHNADLDLRVGAVKATGSLALTGLPANNETFSLANVTVTAKSSGATGNQFNIGASASATATAIATLVNSSASFTGIVTASANSGTVTFTAVLPGAHGNGIQLSEAMANTTATAFSGGTNGTLYSMDLA